MPYICSLFRAKIFLVLQLLVNSTDSLDYLTYKLKNLRINSIGYPDIPLHFTRIRIRIRIVSKNQCEKIYIYIYIYTKFKTLGPKLEINDLLVKTLTLVLYKTLTPSLLATFSLYAASTSPSLSL